MLTYQPGALPPTFQTLLDSFAHDDGLPFADLLSADDIQHACDHNNVSFAQSPDDVWTPALTLWTFLTQCLSDAKSCVAAVARAMVLRIGLGLPPCSANTGAYCKARAKLPEPLLRGLTLQVGIQLERQAPDSWRWYARRVVLVDGTEVSLSDTPDNQRAYPQPCTQRPGLGFPQLRLVVLLGFATAALLGAALGPCQGKQTGELALFRTLLGQVVAGDVIVADRYYCSWWLVALLLACGADVVFRLHQQRHADFRRGRRLGRDDHVVNWPKPPRPAWMDEETYESLPGQLTVRQLRVRVDRPGCRVRQLVVATTLLDARAYPHADIADLYHRRWHVELDIRNLKVTLGMDVLSCKTPEMVRKEIWTHLLGYNLIRKVLAQAALAGQRTPRQLSFAGALQTWQAFRWLLVLELGDVRGAVVRALLLAVSTHAVGNRPDRVEPREVKRRPKGKRMTRPRAQRRAELLGQAGTIQV
jgi:DDE family transposase